jgi:hypothetical protein
MWYDCFLYIAVLYNTFVLIEIFLKRDVGLKAISIGLATPRCDMGGLIFPIPKSLDSGRVQYWASMRFMDQEFGMKITEFMRSDHNVWTVSIIALLFFYPCSHCFNNLFHCHNIFCYVICIAITIILTYILHIYV